MAATAATAMRRALSAFCKLSLAIWLPVCAAGCAWIEEPSVRYDTRAAAAHAGMFEKGWLPEWLPASSARIREKHAIDTGASILRFEFDPARDRPPFGEACSPIERNALEAPRLDAGWWPQTAALRAMPALYRCRRDSAYLAVAAEPGIAYFWRISA